MVSAKDFSIIILAGITLSTAFAPLGLWFAAPIAYAIYLHFLKGEKHLLLYSFLIGFVSNAIILSWSKTFVGVLPWILLSILQGLYLIPVGVVARYIKKPIVLISIILLMDEVKNYLPFGGFGWTRIAFSQVESPLISLVSITGIVGVSLLTLLIALSFIRPNKYLITTLLLAALISPLVLSQTPSGATLNVRVVQGGVPERGLAFNSRAQAVLDNHIKATLRDIQQRDELIIWPENAIDVDPMQNEIASSKLRSLQQSIGKPLLAGVILNNTSLLNTAILFNESATPQSIYVKRYLTPFGEYIPLRSLTSMLSKHAERVTDFTPGEKFVNHKIGSTSVSSIICYEILNDSIIRESARNSGAMAVLTNSATFAGSAEGEQQLAITRIRAIESGRNILSVSTTGPSAFIDYRGNVLKKLDDGEVGSISLALEIRENETIATRYGSLLSSLVMLTALLILGYSLLRRFAPHRRTLGKAVRD